MAESTCQAPFDILKISGLSDEKWAHLTKVVDGLVDLLKSIDQDLCALVLAHIDHEVEPFRRQSQLASTSLGSLLSTPKSFPASNNQRVTANLDPQIEAPRPTLKTPSAILAPSTPRFPLIGPYPGSKSFTTSNPVSTSKLKPRTALPTSPTPRPRLRAPSPNRESFATNHSTPALMPPGMASRPPPESLKRRLSSPAVEPAKKKVARRVPRNLQDIEWALNDKISRMDLWNRRDEFYRQLEAIEVEKSKENKKQSATSKKSNLQIVIEITKFFFNEVMGPDAFTRVGCIITDYNARIEVQIDSNAVIRAMYLESINGIPTVIRSFYTSFANAERFNINSISSYTRLLKSKYDVELYKSFLALCDSAEKKDPSLIQFLESKGLKTGLGRTYRSLAMKYIQKELGFDEERTELQNRCQAGQGLAQVVEHFGEGVLLLLPSGAATRLKAWGTPRMTHANGLLKETIPEFADVCKAAYDSFFVPITTGQTVNVQQSKTPTSLSQVFQTTNQHSNASVISATPHAIAPISTFNQKSDLAFSGRGYFNTLRAIAPAPAKSQQNLQTSNTQENRSIGYFATVLSGTPAPSVSQKNVLATNTSECLGTKSFATLRALAPAPTTSQRSAPASNPQESHST